MLLLDWVDAVAFLVKHTIRGWDTNAVVAFVAKHDLDPVDMIDLDLEADQIAIFDNTVDAIMSGSYYQPRKVQATATDMECWV